MLSRLRVAGFTIAVGLLCTAGTAAAGGTNCSWGSTVGTCGSLKFNQSSYSSTPAVKTSQSGWKVFGSSATQGGVAQFKGLPKFPSSLPPIANSVAGKFSHAFLSKNKLKVGGPAWSTGGGPKKRPGMVGAVPEPETWLMMVGGIGALGWFARRRSQRLSVVA